MEKAYDRANREALGQVLKMYDVKSMYVNSLVRVRVKGAESEGFKIDSGMKQGCIMSP